MQISLHDQDGVEVYWPAYRRQDVVMSAEGNVDVVTFPECDEGFEVKVTSLIIHGDEQRAMKLSVPLRVWGGITAVIPNLCMP